MDESEQGKLAAVAADLRAHLEWLRESGVSQIPVVGPLPSAQAPSAQGGGKGAAPPAVGSLRQALKDVVGREAGPKAPGPSPGLRSPDGGQAPAPAASLEQIRVELGDCRRCKLDGKRRHVVFGVGNPKAELVFVGEGPGEEEDKQGIPFVGAAGQLLTRMIEAMGFKRDEVYICNVVKCRPPGNRNPEPDEIEACEPFLKAQLSSIGPKVIVTLGKFAAQTLLRDATPITRMRGRWREYCGVRLMPTFHPAYLLRSPNEKKKAWDDLQQVMKAFGREPKKP